MADLFHEASSASAIEAEAKYAAHNYHPLPVVLSKGQGCTVWDPEGNEYLDFLSAYSAVNQGHCHPELVKTMTDQASRLTLTSRAFYNDVLPRFSRFVTEYFNYEMVLPMNTGAEAVETSIKLARKWGYKVKGIPENEALIFSADGNFHGRTFGPITMSTDPESRDRYGPYVPNLGSYSANAKRLIRYNNIEDLRAVLEVDGPKTAAFIVEPIQGEAGIMVPDDDYLPQVAELCRKHNVLFICDEIQTGVARTGRMLCSEWWGVKPDVILLGKAISGGMYPVSCVLSSKEIMLTIEPGTHGSTYGGNPLGTAIAIRALQLVKEEQMVEKALERGEQLRIGLERLKSQSPIIQTVRGKGLLLAIVIDESQANGRTAWDLCLLFKDRGLLAKPTHNNIIRLAPPLIVSEEQIDSALTIIESCLKDLPNVKTESKTAGTETKAKAKTD